MVGPGIPIWETTPPHPPRTSLKARARAGLSWHPPLKPKSVTKNQHRATPPYHLVPGNVLCGPVQNRQNGAFCTISLECCWYDMRTRPTRQTAPIATSCHLIYTSLFPWQRALAGTTSFQVYFPTRKVRLIRLSTRVQWDHLLLPLSLYSHEITPIGS